MNVFSSYAPYYDLLYKDKDYKGEARYILKLVQRCGTAGRRILELGCGTGAHAIELAASGFEIQGVDRSAQMLELASRRLTSLPGSQAKRVRFSYGDVRTLRLHTEFDAVISLFHVMSYQTTNEDLMQTFDTAAAHIKPGGIFIFDCWYGPAVLHDCAVVRVKHMENDTMSVTRIAEPRMYPNENLVDVSYRVFVKDKTTGSIEELCETHKMRYLFKTEIVALFENVGFELVDCEEWLTGRKPGLDTWSVCFVGKPNLK